jgi:hypothetical protein
MAHGLYRRNDSWYWRVNLRRHARHPRTFRNRRPSCSVDVALSLGDLAYGERIEIAARLSALFTVWMARLEMIGILEKLPHSSLGYRPPAPVAISKIQPLEPVGAMQ